ncbi:TlpA family protein disulfide reductase, partial [Sphingobacterium suaedae]
HTALLPVCYHGKHLHSFFFFAHLAKLPIIHRSENMYLVGRILWFARFVYKGFPFIVSRDVLANDMVIIPDKPYFERAESKLFKKNGANINLLGDSFNLTMSKTAATIFLHTTRNLDPTHFVVQPVSLKVVGETIDTFKLIKPLKGKDIITQNLNNISNLKGKYVLLYFWSDKCRPCINSLPVLNQVYKKLKSREFEIFGVIDIRDKGNVSGFLKKC